MATAHSRASWLERLWRQAREKIQRPANTKRSTGGWSTTGPCVPGQLAVTFAGPSRGEALHEIGSAGFGEFGRAVARRGAHDRGRRAAAPPACLGGRALAGRACLGAEHR